MKKPVTAKAICLNPVTGQLMFAWFLHPALRDHKGDRILLWTNINRRKT